MRFHSSSSFLMISAQKARFSGDRRIRSACSGVRALYSGVRRRINWHRLRFFLGRQREVSEVVRSVRSPVVQRMVSEYFLHVVEVLLVVFQASDELRAVLGVEPDVRERFAGFLDSVVDADLVRDESNLMMSEPFAELLSDRDSRYEERVRFLVRVVRKVNRSYLSFLTRYEVLYHAEVMFEGLPAVLVVVDEVMEESVLLFERYGERVVDSEVEEQIDGRVAVEREFRNSSFLACRLYLVCVVRAYRAHVERAVVFLLYHLFRHSLPAFRFDVFLRDDFRIVHGEFRIEPFGVVLRHRHQVVEVVFTVRGGVHYFPSSVFRENRSHHVSDGRILESVLGVDYSLRGDTAERVDVFRA